MEDFHKNHIRLASLFIFLLFSGSAKTQGADTTVFQRVEEMPRFIGCKHDTLSSGERQPCSEMDFLKFLAANLKYPPMAVEDVPQSRFVVNFVIEKDGAVSHVEFKNPITKSYEDEVMRVMKLMPPWIPGRQNGEAVRVQFTLPLTVCFR